jgi:hypothetical protein
MKNKNSRVSMSTGIFVALVLAFASSVTQATDHVVTVSFDGAGCPTGVDKNEVDMKHGGTDKIHWVSSPVTGGFQVFFDPFRGSPITAHSSGAKLGETNWKNLDPSAPLGVVFKYSIYNPACPNSPLDPRIRIF